MITAIGIDIFKGHYYQVAFVHHKNGVIGGYRVNTVSRLARLQSMQAALLDPRSPDERAQDEQYTDWHQTNESVTPRG